VAFLTDFADQAVMLPVMALIAAALAITGWWRGLLAWMIAIPGVLGTMAVLKYVFFACGILFAETGIQSPSGHTAAAAAIYGGSIVILLRGRAPWPLLATVPPCLALLFGISRVAVGAHDVPEVVAGAAVGLAGAALLVAIAGRRPSMRLWPIALSTMVVMLAFHGLRLHAEGFIHNFAFLTWLPLPAVCRA
jgi:membrane-associated phospholipid phosphatase